MALRRSYEDGCAAAHALDVVGERWALLVVRELMFGAKRFTDLRAGLPGISPNVLTLRLEELEAASVLRRRRLPPPSAAWVYELSDWGRELGPILEQLGRWGAQSPLLAPGFPVSVASLMMSLAAMLDAEAAQGVAARVGFEFGDDSYHAILGPEGLQVARGELADAEVVVCTDAAGLAAVLYGGQKLTEALRGESFAVRGDKAVLRRFLALFPSPPTAPAV